MGVLRTTAEGAQRITKCLIAECRNPPHPPRAAVDRPGAVQTGECHRTERAFVCPSYPRSVPPPPSSACVYWAQAVFDKHHPALGNVHQASDGHVRRHTQALARARTHTLKCMHTRAQAHPNARTHKKRMHTQNKHRDICMHAPTPTLRHPHTR